jgi:hypothetical protein
MLALEERQRHPKAIVQSQRTPNLIIVAFAGHFWLSIFGPNGLSVCGPNGLSIFGPNGLSKCGPNGLSKFGPNGLSNCGPNGLSIFLHYRLWEGGQNWLSKCGPNGLSNVGHKRPLIAKNPPTGIKCHIEIARVVSSPFADCQPAEIA